MSEPAGNHLSLIIHMITSVIPKFGTVLSHSENEWWERAALTGNIAINCYLSSLIIGKLAFDDCIISQTSHNNNNII